MTLAARAPGALALVRPDGTTATWAELVDAGARQVGSAPAPAVEIVGGSDAHAATSLVGALVTGRPALLLHPRGTPALHATQRAAVQAAATAVAGSPNATAASGATESSDRGPAVSLADTATLVGTSGSTGAPRLVAHTADALVASATAAAANLPIGPGDRWWLGMPIAHVGGMSVVTRAMLAGAAFVCADRFDERAFLLALHEARVTVASLVPTMLQRVLDVADSPPPSTLRAVLVGGGPCAPSLVARARRAGWPVLLTWGMTEACSQIATQPLRVALSDADDDCSDVGAPLPGFEVALRGDRAWLRGPAMMRGYLGEPPAFDADGWFDSRDDVAWTTRGTLRILGRGRELIISGGENVYPAEVENALCAVPGIEAACVVGVPDTEWGERVVAVVVGDPSAEASARAHLATALPRFKHPAALLWTDTLPLTAANKLDRDAARAFAMSRVGPGN